MSTSLKSIAAKTKLSVRTVAYILNTDRAKLFRPETRKKVEAAAAELGYRPNAAAQAMRRGRFDAVGLIQATRPDRGLLSIFTLAAIEDELLQRDQRLVMSMVPDSQLADDERMPKMLREWSVDGLMVAYSAEAPEALSQRLDRDRVPSVWINTRRPTNSVYPDDHGAGVDATRRLIAAGHKRIAYLQYFYASGYSHYSVIDRRAGYEQAMLEAGLKPWFVEPREVIERGDRIAFVRTLLTQPKRPTALLTYGGSDHTLPALLAIRDLQMAIGRDVSLIGFADGLMADSGIDISTMGLPTYRVGQEAVKLLTTRIESAERASSDSVVVPLDFYPGETFGPAPQK
jgi:LacI family transcriptional regulator